VRQNLFTPLGITDADCKPSSNHTALSYPPPPIGSTQGTDWGDWTLACGGGGWVMSADDLYKVVLDLTGGHTLLSDAQKTQMNSNCLGWDCSVGVQPDFVGKNGILQTGNLGLWTFYGIFKGSVPVILLVNSNTPGNITGLVQTAFVNAAVPHP
jgi:CubicO group peptidase (beta-lactamase class C family)